MAHEINQFNNFHFAKIRFRWLALVVDGAILNSVVNLLVDYLHRYAAIQSSESMNLIYRNGVFAILFIVYSVAFEASFGGTIGKYLFKIRVIDRSGGRISFANSLVRNLAKLIPFEILSCFAGRSNIIHDKIANAAVIKV